MKQFKVEYESEKHATLILVTEEREWTIMYRMERDETFEQRVIALCRATVAGMDIAKPQSRNFRVVGLSPA